MKNVLRGLYFKTGNMTEYYYDDCSAMVFPCPEGLKEAIERIRDGSCDLFEDRHDTNNLNQWERFILQRYKAYGAFARESEQPHYITEADDIRVNIENNGFRQLILTVTSNCNLRCKYCINSSQYPYRESNSAGKMTFDTAKRAVDFYIDNLERIRQHDPARMGVITFYGGEPLLELDLIKNTIRYIASRNQKKILYTISTNGVLMDEEAIDFLVENKVAVWVSIDGPKEEHDRNRVFYNGTGTFDQVIKNIRLFWDKYPKYPVLCFLQTHDWRTDLRKLSVFFNSDERFRRSLFMFNPVSANFTDYYSQFTKAERDAFFTAFYELKDSLAESKDDNNPVGNYLLLTSYHFHMIRRIFGKPGRPEIPATGACIPGEKICVMPDGRFQPCEKVPGLADMGTVESGLDFGAISRLLHEYNKRITSGCSDCPVSRLCRLCYAHFWSGKEFTRPSVDFCRDQVVYIVKNLSETYSYMEEHPEFSERLARQLEKRYTEFAFQDF